VEAIKLKTVADLELVEDERVELINGEIVRRPMARSEHAVRRDRIRLGVFVRGRPVNRLMTGVWVLLLAGLMMVGPIGAQETMNQLEMESYVIDHDGVDVEQHEPGYVLFIYNQVRIWC